MVTQSNKEKIKDILNFKAVNLNVSGTCNLNCKYCYLPKNPEIMNALNNDVINWIKSGEMEDDIIYIAGDNLENLGLWGGETTINFPEITARLPFLYKKFPKLKEINFSTNLSTSIIVDNISDFIKEIDRLNKELDRKLEIRIQVSFDGPGNLNQLRGISPDTIVKNVIDLNSKIRGCNCWYGAFKGTHGSSNIEYLSDYNNLRDFYKFFDNLYDELGERGRWYGGEYITYIFPGTYDHHDGKNLGNLLKILNSKDFKNENWNNRMCFLEQMSDRYLSYLNIIKNYWKLNFNELHNNLTCSAGDSCISLGPDKKIYMCHDEFFYDDKISNFLKNEDNKESGINHFGANRFLKDAYIINSDEILKLIRIVSNARTKRFSEGALHQYSTMVIDLLSSQNYISPLYKDSPYKEIAIGYMMMSGRGCPIHNIIENGSIYVEDISQYLLFLNGALEVCLDVFA